MYDLIGDIHGHADALKELLQKIDYKQVDNIWQHPSSTAIFVGDYIDRGPAIRETLQIVHAMVEAGKAIALLGNHEYNALAYAHQLPDRSFLRTHNEKNRKQHAQTLEQFRYYEEEWQDYLAWFYTLHLYLELPGLRAVHACWDQDHIKWLNEKGYSSMNTELLLASHEKGSKANDVINDTLKGKEIAITEEYAWPDKDGHMRSENRLKWWVDTTKCYGEFLFDCPDALKDAQVNSNLKIVVYPKDAVPVFFGHYWLNDQVPFVQSGNVVCLNFAENLKQIQILVREDLSNFDQSHTAVFSNFDHVLKVVSQGVEKLSSNPEMRGWVERGEKTYVQSLDAVLHKIDHTANLIIDFIDRTIESLNIVNRTNKLEEKAMSINTEVAEMKDLLHLIEVNTIKLVEKQRRDSQFFLNLYISSSIVILSLLTYLVFR